jgi:cobalt/nickel transport system permease protein
MWIVSGFALAFSARRINKRFDDKLAPYIGVLSAVIFAAQFVNFPVPPFSSGHLVGSTLVAVMLGPWAGILILGLVLFVQALYGDGGILTYGLNTFNMGVFSCIVGWALAFALFKISRRIMDEKRAVLVATAIASYVVTVLAGFLLGFQLLTVPGFGFEALAAITGVHAIIGVGEAILTFVILMYFVKAKPQIISFLKESEVSDMARIGETPIPVVNVQGEM